MNSEQRPRIVVGVDGFESSKAALRWAIHQAKLTGAEVEAVTAWQIPAGSLTGPRGRRTPVYRRTAVSPSWYAVEPGFVPS